MLDLPTAPFLPVDKLRLKANSFLRKFNPTREIPVPIERIVDVQLGIIVTGIPGLLKQLDIDGFLLSDLREIWVDKDLYDIKHPRFLFTLAHEIGHYYLHKKIYSQILIKDTASWKNFHKNLDENKLKWFEWHAYMFAGLILVPTKQLKNRCNIHLCKMKKAGAKTPGFMLDALVNVLARDFLVSKAVIKKRLENEAILPSELRKELFLARYNY